MGDNDSRSDAKEICFRQAQKKAVEQAGVVIRSQTTVQNFELKANEIEALTAAAAKSERMGDRFFLEGSSQRVECTIKIDVDTADLRRRLDQIASDPNAKKNLDQTQQRIQQLEKQLDSLSAALKVASGEQAIRERAQRTATLSDLAGAEAALQSWRARTIEIDNIKNIALQHVKLSMNREEIKKILGEPTRKSDYVYIYGSDDPRRDCIGGHSQSLCIEFNYGGYLVRMYLNSKCILSSDLPCKRN
jgi:outer membrane protein assembly factor BamE (lipoprotein component of BamABCDE complex)